MKIAKSTAGNGLHKNLDNINASKKTVDLSQTTLFSSVDLNLPDELVISTQPTRDVRKKMFKSIPQFSEPRFSELSRASVDRSSISARSQENKTADYYVVNAVNSDSTNSRNPNNNTNVINRKLLK